MGGSCHQVREREAVVPVYGRAMVQEVDVKPSWMRLHRIDGVWSYFCPTQRPEVSHE